MRELRTRHVAAIRRVSDPRSQTLRPVTPLLFPAIRENGDAAMQASWIFRVRLDGHVHLVGHRVRRDRVRALSGRDGRDPRIGHSVDDAQTGAGPSQEILVISRVEPYLVRSAGLRDFLDLAGIS